MVLGLVVQCVCCTDVRIVFIGTEGQIVLPGLFIHVNESLLVDHVKLCSWI